MKKMFLYIPLFFFLSLLSKDSPDMYFCTAANHKYFPHLQNLIGSIHATNYEATQEIAIFDLGLTNEDKNWLKKINKVALYDVELTHPDILKPVKISNDGKMVPGWYAWKPVVIKQTLDIFPYVLWVDAGTTILKPLDPLFEYIKKSGYFLATIGDRVENEEIIHTINWETTQYIKGFFNLNDKEDDSILSKEAVISGIIGVSKQEKDSFIIPMYEMSKNLRNYQDDGTAPEGFGTARHDQSILGILAYVQDLIVHKQDLTQTKPISLMLDGKQTPLYVTWHKDYVCKKTHIYSSREDLYNLNYYLSKIRYKK